MRLRTYEKLRALHRDFGCGVFGKIAQKLLALSFRVTGATHVVERGVQGVDIDVVLDRARYAFEVKTTEGTEFQLDDGNLSALRDRAADGYSAGIAILHLAPGEDWQVAALPLKELRPGACSIDRFRNYRLAQIETSICSAFEEVVDEEFEYTRKDGQRHLDGKLRSHGIEVRD
jgi:Holliday junction resolvase